MEKIGTKKIQINAWTKLDFDIYPCNCKVGDTVWFDDGIESSHYYMHGKVTEIEPDHWWVYDDGEKELGRITVKVEDDEFYTGQNFSVAFKDIIYEEPEEEPVKEPEEDIERKLYEELKKKFG